MKLHTTTATLTLALLLFLLLASPSLQLSVAGAQFCDGKCAIRCSKASRHDDCLKYCRICCADCNCVPSGTAGNKDECPCYRDKTTGEGDRKRPKCP
ncbi:peamaclein-like [Phragmites australis]|uniref:peamaclein-like n=1 Tax=Phragmites australis TaxID=29695 RepID=UPI002D77A1D4|nr:peamaclein-like [Phragmites australis]